MNHMNLKILFKYPSRGRRDRFIEGMNSILNNINNTEDFQILVSADMDDPDMNYEIDYPNTKVVYGSSLSKIHAVNRDIEQADDWDIIVVMSDDMRFAFKGFDNIIRGQFQDGNLDKLIHIPDQDAKGLLATMYIAGKDFYNRFGFVYDPQFKSVFCDNLVQDVAKRMFKYHYLPLPGIILHLNPAYGHLPKDQMFLEQQSYWQQDSDLYNNITKCGLEYYIAKYEPTV